VWIAVASSATRCPGSLPWWHRRSGGLPTRPSLISQATTFDVWKGSCGTRSQEGPCQQSLQLAPKAEASAAPPAPVTTREEEKPSQAGAAESITLTESHVLVHLWAWKHKIPPHIFLILKPHAWRTLFSDYIRKLKLTQWEYRPYSLRRGSATHLFVKTGSLDKVVVAGRWSAVKTARIYIKYIF
jgi:hypothetical protein